MIVVRESSRLIAVKELALYRFESWSSSRCIGLTVFTANKCMLYFS